MRLIVIDDFNSNSIAVVDSDSAIHALEEFRDMEDAQYVINSCKNPKVFNLDDPLNKAHKERMKGHINRIKALLSNPSQASVLTNKEKNIIFENLDELSFHIL